MNRDMVLIMTSVFVMVSFNSVDAQGIIRCGTTDHMNTLIANDPNWSTSMSMLETAIQGGLRKAGTDNSIIDIPTVVHVVYNNSTQNISDAQIQSQITVLNQDFRKMLGTPGYNSNPIGADTYIQFHLATVDPNGNQTNGITRTQTSVTSFSGNDNVKYTSSGGCDAWDRTKYLNIWVCNLGGGLLGYTQFPDYPGTVGPYAAATDGVVILYAAFGNTGTQGFPGHYDMGRTTTHEVGHWLALRHTWGDVSDCSGTDYVDDTPPCSGQYYAGESGYVSCGGNVIQCSNQRRLIEDYMDYSDDECMDITTQGQSARMRAAIYAARPTFANPSVIVDQKLSTGTQVGTIGRWNGSAFPNPRLTPGQPIVFVRGATEVLQGDQAIYSGQKYNKWTRNSNAEPNILNHHSFTIQNTDFNFTSSFLQTNDATIQAQLLEGGNPGGSVSFQDPWLIDYPDPNYGNNPRNEGMSAPFKTVAYSSSNLGTSTSYKGVFLGLDPSQGATNYYSVLAPLTQTNINGVTGYFQSWSASNATLQQVGSNPNGNDQKAVVFTNSGGTVTANYKGVHLSSTSSAFAANGQRKFVRTADGVLHLVYESGGHVWYEMSTDNGTTWTLANGGKPLDANGGKLPAIDCQSNPANYVGIVWEEPWYGAAQLKIACFGGGYMGFGYPLQAFVDLSVSYDQNLNPVIAYDYEGRVMIAWENKSNYTGIPVGIAWMYGPLGIPAPLRSPWYLFEGAVSSTDVNCVCPTIAVAKNPTNQYFMMFQLAWQYNQSSSYSYIKYCQLTTDAYTMSQSSIVTPSDGAGFWQNQNPSIASMTDSTARLVWHGYAPWYGNRAVYRSSNPDGTWSGTIMNMGSNVLQTFVNNNADGTFVLGWVQNNGSLTNNFVRSDYLYGVKSFSTSGNNLQLNNASSFGSMYGMAFQNQIVPYSFAQSSNIGSIPKASIQVVSTGRGVVLSCAGKQYCAGVADISIDGKSVAFVPISGLPSSPIRDTLSHYLRTEAFLVGNGSKIALSLFHGMINPVDSSDIVSSTSGDGPIGICVMVVDADNGQPIAELAQYVIAEKQRFPTDVASYSLSLTRSSMTPQMRIEIQLSDQGHPQYTVNDFFSVGRAIALTKPDSSNVLVDLGREITTFSLESNYPNPFNPSTQIRYSLPEAGSVSLKIYDVLGREIVNLADGYQQTGRYTVTWNATQNSGVPVSSGVYFARLRVTNDLGGVRFTKTTRLLLMK